MYYESQVEGGGGGEGVGDDRGGRESRGGGLAPLVAEGLLQPPGPRLSVLPPAWEDFSSGEESDQEVRRPAHGPWRKKTGR